MNVGKHLNRLLTNCAYLCNKRHLPDVAEVLKQAAVLAGQDYLRDVTDDLEELNKAFEAKITAGENVTADDLPVIPPPAEPDPEETFEPLPDVTDEVVEEAPAEEDEDDFLADLEDDLDEAESN